MKRIFFALFIMLTMSINASAQAKMQVDKLTHDFGTFSREAGVQVCTFIITNVGDKPLVINQAMASCGCTVPKFTKEPIKPGEKGELKIEYNGTSNFPGKFKKSIAVRTNGAPQMTRLYVQGVMTE